MDMMTTGGGSAAGGAAGALLAAGGGVEAAGIADAEASGIDDGAADAAGLVIASGFCDPPQATLAATIAATEQNCNVRFETILMAWFPLFVLGLRCPQR